MFYVKQKKQACLIAISNTHFFSINILEIIDLVRDSFLRCQLSYFSLGQIRLHRYGSFFRFTLLLLGNLNVNPASTTVNDNSIPLIILLFHVCYKPTMPSRCVSSEFQKAHYSSKLSIFKNKTFV